MDQKLLNIRDALTDARVSMAQQFQRITEVVDKRGLGGFLIIYCRQAAMLAHWMSEWHEQLRQKMTNSSQEQLRDVFTKVSEQLLRRYQEFDTDSLHVAQWVEQNLEGGCEPAHDKLLISTGMKQLRFIFQECIKRNDCMSWLLVMTELERLRVVHGFTFVKMCELYFGKSILRCFTHIHYQHQGENELFGLCEQALEKNVQLHTTSLQSMIRDVKMAIEAYACFIDDCYKISVQWMKQDVKSISQN